MSWFDHFDSLDSSRWGSFTSGTGSVSVTDSILTLNCAANLDAAGVYDKTKVDTTKAQLWAVCVSGTNLNAASGIIWPAAVFNHSGGMVAEAQATALTDVRTRSVFANANSIQFSYRTSAAGTNVWRTDNTWGTASGDAIHAMADDYYVLILETDPTLGFRWLAIHDTFTLANTWDFDQGMRVFAITDWVAWASVDATQSDMYFTLGWPINNTNRTGAINVEWVRYADGTKTHAWVNQRTSGGAWNVKHHYSLDRELFVPEDRTTVAVDVGAGGAWDDAHIQARSTVFDGSTYHMMYAGSDGSVYGLGYASDANGSGTWTKSGSNPILAASTGNQAQRYAPYLIKDNADPDSAKRWKLWFVGVSAVPEWRIYYCYSDAPDGTYSTPVECLGPGSGADSAGCSNPVVFHYNGLWWMYYGMTTGTSDTWQIGRAYASAPGGPWTKEGTNPIVPNQRDALQVITANINGRTASMASTTGFEVDQPVLVAASTSDYSISRIRKITTNTSLELYHALTGFTSAGSAMVFGFNAGVVTPHHIEQVGSEWWLYVTPFSLGAQHGSFAPYHETSGIMTASSPIPAAGGWTWKWRATPPVYTGSWNNERSSENISVARAPLSAYTTSDSSGMRPIRHGARRWL